MNLVGCDVGGARWTALLVLKVHRDALITEGMPAVGDKGVFDHAHTYWTREIVLVQSEQLGCSKLHLIL